MKAILVTDDLYDVIQKFSESEIIREMTDDSKEAVIYAASYLLNMGKRTIEDKGKMLAELEHEAGQSEWNAKKAEMKLRKYEEANHG